ncbi:MAG: DNA-3-methyladenine glycosylase [Candidatus Kaiserbacteria bacterium]|nr:DNA-3-methyladenine glycosylase [Candidatus Kaiserbacteria bacterium]
MKRDRLPPSFFTQQTTLQLAESLIGCILVHETASGVVTGRIVETEAYTESDAASHSVHGKVTDKNASMFLPAGHLYTYQIYGHVCCNIVAEREGKGCAVLLRAAVPMNGIPLMLQRRGIEPLSDGPGKLCQAFGITQDHNGLDLTNAHAPLFVAPKEVACKVVRTPRIGISRATEKMWRFVAGDAGGILTP